MNSAKKYRLKQKASQLSNSAFSQPSLFSKLSAAIFALIFAGIGGYLIFSSFAGGSNTNSEAENGTIAGNACKVSDSNASGGQAVKFGCNNSSFMQVCGTQLCLSGTPFIVHGATAYGTYDNPGAEITLAQQAKVNTLELVEFDNTYHTMADLESSATWNRVDAFIAAASNAHLHVILHIAELGQTLTANGYNFSTTATGGSFPNLGWQGDYNQYLSFIANRVNTVSGVTYKNDPTISMLEIWGEIPAPNGDGGAPSCRATCWTTSQMQSFYTNTINQWKSLAPNILVSSGGFSYLNDSGSGIPWQNILSLSGNAVCGVELNSSGDETVSVPSVTNYCKPLNKPWFLAAWSSCYQPNGQTYPFYTTTDAQMASHAQDMYNVEHGQTQATYRAMGSDFWNLQNQGTQAGTCSLSPSFPQTFAVVQNNAP